MIKDDDIMGTEYIALLAIAFINRNFEEEGIIPNAPVKFIVKRLIDAIQPNTITLQGIIASTVITYKFHELLDAGQTPKEAGDAVKITSYEEIVAIAYEELDKAQNTERTGHTSPDDWQSLFDLANDLMNKDSGKDH